MFCYFTVCKPRCFLFVKMCMYALHTASFNVHHINYILKFCLDWKKRWQTTSFWIINSQPLSYILCIDSDIYCHVFQKFDGKTQSECKKFSVDPEITSFEMLQNILAKAFEINWYCSVIIVVFFFCCFYLSQPKLKWSFVLFVLEMIF